MQKARAFVFAAEEDFGIIPIEAQSCGTPVIAYGRGGVKETVKGLAENHPTGHFFPEQTSDSIRRAIIEFEAAEFRIKPSQCRENALKFSAERFRNELKTLLNEKLPCSSADNHFHT